MDWSWQLRYVLLRLWRHYWYTKIFEVLTNHKEPKVCVLAEGAEHEVVMVDGVLEGLRLHHLVSLGACQCGG